jgi:uncharacterized protein
MPSLPVVSLLRTAGLLFASNLFMTAAWYGHLKFKAWPMWLAILASWGLALFEYMLQVPANRLAYGDFTAYQLKILQEGIGLVVFIGFAAAFLGEGLTPRHLLSFVLIMAGVTVAFTR